MIPVPVGQGKSTKNVARSNPHSVKDLSPSKTKVIALAIWFRDLDRSPFPRLHLTNRLKVDPTM